MSNTLPSREALLAECDALRRRVAQLEASERPERAKAYRALVEACPDAVVMADLEGRILVASPEAGSLLGLERGIDLRGRNAFGYVAPQDAGRLQANLRDLIEKGERKNDEYSMVRPDGMALPVDVAAALLRDRNGCPKAVIAIIRDVTERKRAEAALRESRDELQAIYDAMIDGVVIVDLETKGCLRANARMAALLGYSLEELPRDANAVHRPEDMPLLAAKFQAQVEGRLPLAENVPFLRKDGSVIYTDVSSQPMEYQGRKCRICFVRDVTEWKRAEEELRESRERFRAGFEEAPIGIVLADKERKLMRVNRAFCHMLGYTAEELIGRRVPEFLYPEDHERVMPLVQAVFRGEQASFTIEKRYLRKDGASFWVQATTSAVHGPDGEVAFVMGIVEDIDARKRAQEAWQREHQTLWHMLRSSDHERQLIAYEIHDGLAQQLAAALMQFQTHDHLHTLQPSQAQLAYEAGVQMVRQAHFEARRLISGVRPPILDESGIVAALAHLVHEQQMHGGPKIEFHSEASFGRLAPVLENAIYRVAQEAMANACQHSRSPQVHVQLRETAGHLTLEVRDWGVGFDPRAIGPDSFGVEGIRERARLLGGTMTIQSRPGEGTRLCVVLPLVIDDGAALPAG